MQAKTYEELMDAANDARIDTNDTEAIKLYKEALKQSGSRDTEAHWMLAVSLTNSEEYDEALRELDAVLKMCDDSDKPNVLRDRARVLTKLKRFEESASDIQQSLSTLEASENTGEYGATLGFGARLKTEQGGTKGALEDFKKADAILKGSDNRHYELYNKLHYAEALVNSGDKELAEEVITEAEALIPQYGGEKHTQRAQELREKLKI